MPAIDPLSRLGITRTSSGAELRIFSENAYDMRLHVFDPHDPSKTREVISMVKDGPTVWRGRSDFLVPGAPYAVQVSGPEGPRHAFDDTVPLLDPYARGVLHIDSERWLGVVIDDQFDWGSSKKPATILDRSVIYEAHVRGLTALHPDVPEDLRGTYAGIGHEVTIGYLGRLGITAIELLPVQVFASERRLRETGLSNYWGYNTVNFFSPHNSYATTSARNSGAGAVVNEFKTMVKRLHEAGIEVILDVVYNHTAEEGRNGPTLSMRGIDNSTYYRQDDDGNYIDVTGCGNTVNFGHPIPNQLVLDSLRYWTNEMQVDGFRFDLATVLGRGADGAYTPHHPLLTAILADPALQSAKMIAEPWDVGIGGWQTGNFPQGYSEWNDRYRDRVRNFWLADVESARRTGQPLVGIGGFATRLAGSSNTFSAERGPLASVNFVTAHDGFTMADLTAFNTKHNLGNGENNSDGTDNNRSFNHGIEGTTTDESILRVRRKAHRNLMGTLLLSAGVPMITAGDEYGRTQYGNNNLYCQDSSIAWLSWLSTRTSDQLRDTTRRLIQLRDENPALRPSRYAVLGETTPNASHMDWYDASGNLMDDDDWNSPRNRTLQYLATSTPDRERLNRVLLIVHGVETDIDVTLPSPADVVSYQLLWDSALDTAMTTEGEEIFPGALQRVTGTSLQLYRANC